MPGFDRKKFVATLAAQYGQRLSRFLSVRLRDARDVPDLAQEVFLRLLRVEQQEAIRNPEAYMFTVASHVIHQHALSKSADPVFVEITDAMLELTVAPGEDPAVRTDNAQRVRQLEFLLKQLPPRTAAALVLHRVAGYTVQEIADQLGVGRETVKRYLSRGAQLCRNSRIRGGSAG